MKLTGHRQVYFSLMVAVILHLLPWNGVWLQLRPDFVLMVLLYWILRAPHLCGVGTAWILGLVIDVTNGDLFGENALAYALTAFIALIYQRRLILFNMLQQIGYVFLLLVAHHVIFVLIKSFGDSKQISWLYFLSCFTSIILWYGVLHARGKQDNKLS
jgi:rod shape-determining protein MreD